MATRGYILLHRPPGCVHPRTALKLEEPGGLQLLYEWQCTNSGAISSSPYFYLRRESVSLSEPALSSKRTPRLGSNQDGWVSM